MDDLDLKDKQKEASEAKMIDDAFQHLLNTYLATRHRKKLISSQRHSTLHGKRTKACADCRVSHTSCTPLPWHR